MVEAEGQVERGVAVPGAFGVQKDRAIRSREDILRADVSVYESYARCEGSGGKVEQRSGRLRMASGGGFKVGFETDGVEDRPGGETCGNRGVARGFGVDRNQTPADLGREPQIDVAIAEAFFPDREQRRIEVLHGEEAGLVVTGEHGGSSAREYPRDHFQPVRFVAAARNGGPPFILDAQLSQSPLDHENAVRRLHLEDIGGDAAR